MLTTGMRIDILTIADLSALLSLESIITGRADTAHFLKSRTNSDWANILNSPDYVVYGIFEYDNLIACGTVHFPNGTDARDIPEFSPVADIEMAIFLAVMVNPEYRGRGFMRILQDMRSGAARKRKREKIICKISVDNLNSWKNTINYGFHCVRVEMDNTGRDKMYFIKKLQLTQGYFLK